MSKATERLDELAEGLPVGGIGRLSHADRCGAFFAMHRGFPQSLVAKAFGVTQATASALRNCLTNGRYLDVAREFERLGREEFGERHFSEEMADRIARFRVGVPTRSDFNLRGRAPNPAASEYEGLWELTDRFGAPTTILVYWLDNHGWTYRPLDEEWPNPPAASRTSLKAREAAYAAFAAHDQGRRQA